MTTPTIADELGSVVWHTTRGDEIRFSDDSEGIVNVKALEEKVKEIVWSYVEKALSAAANNAETKWDAYSDYCIECNRAQISVDQNSILNAFTKEQIL